MNLWTTDIIVESMAGKCAILIEAFYLALKENLSHVCLSYMGTEKAPVKLYKEK